MSELRNRVAKHRLEGDKFGSKASEVDGRDLFRVFMLAIENLEPQPPWQEPEGGMSPSEEEYYIERE